jgi:hypothetical protein
VIAGWASRESLEPPLRVGAAGAQSRDFRPLIDNLNAPVAALRTAPRQPVYHVPIRLHPSDPVLSDAQWARVSEGMVHALGLGGPGEPAGWPSATATSMCTW